MAGSLLKEGIENNWVIPTNETKKLTLGGNTSVYPVYKIRLNQLFFNDQNDRIATWLTQYMSENGVDELDMSDLDKYNDIIHQFIVNSNPDAIKRTKNNIAASDQREPGVVLLDGRIIDGNRRFTCLRELSSNPRFNYFEAVILDRDLKHNAKDIKLLELEIQHGTESKVQYNPVDRLVGLYRDIIENQLLTTEEYARGTNESPREVEKKLKYAQLMVEFLEFINAPKQYHIARELELDGPIQELNAMVQKAKSEEEANQIKMAVFTNIAMKPKGDITRFVRQIKDIMKTEYLTPFLEEQMELAADLLDKFEECEQVSTKVLNEVIRTDEQLKEKLTDSMDLAVSKARRDQTLDKPLKQLDKSFKDLEDIDLNILSKLSNQELNRLANKVTHIEIKLEQLKTKLAELL
ncbi:ParB/RepB/Spo0J family partition protein [Turicibacter sanguinis]|uniref:ParB/RepB/Spo0J family partition protein n=1 Tax=Turicibacter sanguinis TaxID=154288 RepID=UPI0018A8C60C|nr:ParB/RepB/Spo0J family partition protein [Turicibacter sanguinis]MDB8563347.1 ParB/RepB/Spo0J family partition protein [Turicibacter sanguinis]